LLIEEKRQNTLNIALIHSLLGDSYYEKAKSTKNNTKLLESALQQYETALSLYNKLKTTLKFQKIIRKSSY